MNKKTLSTIFFILTTLVSIGAQAQDYPDYVITVKGDSIPCVITDPWFAKIKYKDSTMSAAEKITPDRIKEYYVSQNKKLFRAVFIDDNKTQTYLAYAEKGRINLYYLAETYSEPYNTQVHVHIIMSSAAIHLIK